MISSSRSLIILMMLAMSVIGQKQDNLHGDWTAKDAQKILDDSPWGQTQVETDTSEMFYSPTTHTTFGSITEPGATRGTINQATSVNYHIRFLSARPIREAFSRVIGSEQKRPNPKLTAQLRAFVERNFSEYIVIAVTFDTKDGRYANAPNQAFAGAITSTLKSRTYLDRSDGKRLFLAKYIPPSDDGLGAKFVFARMFESKPFLSSDFSEVRFYSEVSKNVKLDHKFKISEMLYNGKLEY